MKMHNNIFMYVWFMLQRSSSALTSNKIQYKHFMGYKHQSAFFVYSWISSVFHGSTKSSGTSKLKILQSSPGQRNFVSKSLAIRTFFKFKYTSCIKMFHILGNGKQWEYPHIFMKIENQKEILWQNQIAGLSLNLMVEYWGLQIDTVITHAGSIGWTKSLIVTNM